MLRALAAGFRIQCEPKSRVNHPRRFLSYDEGQGEALQIRAGKWTDAAMPLWSENLTQLSPQVRSLRCCSLHRPQQVRTCERQVCRRKLPAVGELGSTPFETIVSLKTLEHLPGHYILGYLSQADTPLRAFREVTAMQGQVAVAAQRDQVLLRIIPGLTAKFLVMNLEVLQAPARLTSPSIPLQDFSAKLLVQFGVQS